MDERSLDMFPDDSDWEALKAELAGQYTPDDDEEDDNGEDR